MNLCGERIDLRELTLDDLEAVHSVANHPEVYRYQPFGPNKTEETLTYLRGVINRGRDSPRRDYTLAIVPRATQELVGYASLWIINPEFRQAEIGFFLHPRHWGHGYASDATCLLVRHAFEALHLHRVYATADPRNSASRRVLEKVGMVYEGRLRDVMVIRDGWRDSDVYSVLQPEWSVR